jgi:hypothetical protein
LLFLNGWFDGAVDAAAAAPLRSCFGYCCRRHDLVMIIEQAAALDKQQTG